MGHYFLGVDVGSSKTHAMIADETGKVIGFGQGGAGNPERTDYQDFAILLQQVANQALGEAGLQRSQISGAGFGVSGYDWPAQLEPTMRGISAIGLDAPIGLVNDAIIGLLAGSTQGWGIAVVAGTGCNCWGWDQARKIGRMTGCGEWMGENAGGMDLVIRAVRAIALNWTHRGPDTKLREPLLQLVGAKDQLDFLEGLVLGRYQLSAGYAPLIFQFAEEGDPVANQIILDMTAVLGDMALGVIRQLNFAALEFEVVLVGSLYKAGQLMIDPLQRLIQGEAPKARFVPLQAPPVVGGVLLGMEKAGLDIRSVRPALVQSACRYWDAFSI